jgi:hypothetical protein
LPEAQDFFNDCCRGLRQRQEPFHVHVFAQGGYGRGPTSHNNPLWVAEVNRIAPRLGFAVTAGRSTTKRVPVGDSRA